MIFLVSHSDNTIQAIQDSFHYYFAKSYDRYRFMQSDDLKQDFEAAFLNLYENLVRDVKNRM